MKDLTWLKENLIAHRGLHTLDQTVPENSLESFKLAIEQGYSIEFDINLLKDGEVVVFHDYNLSRLFGIDQTLDEITYQELKHFKLKNSEFIPTLKDTLDFIDGKVPVLIELKPHGNVKQLCVNFMKIMENYNGKYAVFSFHPKVVYYLKKHHKDVIRGQISEFFKSDQNMPRLFKFLMKRMAFNLFTRPDFISYGIYDMPNKYLDKLKKKGITIISYAARSQKDFDFVKSHYDNVVFEYFKPNKKVPK